MGWISQLRLPITLRYLRSLIRNHKIILLYCRHHNYKCNCNSNPYFSSLFYLLEKRYRHIVGIYDHYARISVMCVPFSWCGMTVHTNDAESFLKFKKKGSSLCLANHGSRIDWVITLFGLLTCIGLYENTLAQERVRDFSFLLSRDHCSWHSSHRMKQIT